MVRTFRHAVTRRSLAVREDTRTERLVEADSNWTEVEPETPDKPEPKGATSGTGNAGRRRSPARKVADGDGVDEG